LRHEERSHTDGLRRRERSPHRIGEQERSEAPSLDLSVDREAREQDDGDRVAWHARLHAWRDAGGLDARCGQGEVAHDDS